MWEGKDKENGRDCVHFLYEGGMGKVEGRKERKPALPYLFTFVSRRCQPREATRAECH